MIEHRREKHSTCPGENLASPRLCLDFANTVGVHDGTSPYDHLASYADLVRWSQNAGILTEQEGQDLLDAGVQRPLLATAILQEAANFREAVYCIVSRRVRDIAPDEVDLVNLNSVLARALAHARLVTAPDGIAWTWMAPEEGYDRMLWPVAISAAMLLTSEDIGRVRECAGHNCAWLFLDTTKNHSRRYCSVDGCGNRARARRYYARSRVVAPRDQRSGLS
jgi:predicted RNA-binding Zn ribbon-like protein